MTRTETKKSMLSFIVPSIGVGAGGQVAMVSPDFITSP